MEFGALYDWTPLENRTPGRPLIKGLATLGLGPQWRVAQCRFEGDPKRLELRLEHVPGQHFECPQCRARCGVHDTIERRWRHLNFFQYRCELVAKVPRVLVWQGRGPSGRGPLGTGGQRLYPDDGGADDGAQC